MPVDVLSPEDPLRPKKTTCADLDEEIGNTLLDDVLAGVTGDLADFDDRRLTEAIALFHCGDYAGAIIEAEAAETDARLAAAGAVEPLRSGTEMRPSSRESGGSLVEDREGDSWKVAIDALARVYEDAGDIDSAESLYLRMFAWREGAEQYRAGHFKVAQQLFAKSPDYQTVDDATWFLRNLKPDDGHAVPEVVGLLAMSEPVAAKAAVALYMLALRPKQRTRITNCGGLELVAKAVAYHVENGEIQAAGCGTLRQLCKGHDQAPRNRRALVEQLGGVEAITVSMRCHQFDAEVQREACGCIAAAVNGNAVGARRMIESDAVILCLDAIVNCPEESVGDAASKALGAMLGTSSTQSGDAKEGGTDEQSAWEAKMQSERERGLKHCDRQLRIHLVQDDRIVLQALLGAVRIFAEDANACHRALDLIEPVVVCMLRFKGYKKIQIAGCQIICRLSARNPARDEAVATFCNAGGVAALVQAMQDLPCEVDVQRLAIGALQNVAYGNDHTKTLALRAGGMPATVSGMQRYPRDAALQEQGIGALTSLCDTVGRAAMCCRLGAIEVVITALKRHAAFGHIAELGCIILCMFCDDNQLRQQVTAAGALTIAKNLSRSGGVEAQRWGCELLRDLSEHQL